MDQDFFQLEGIKQRLAPSLSPQAKGRAGVGCFFALASVA
jgi:hypothetical protein